MNKPIGIGRLLRQWRAALAVGASVAALASQAHGYTTGNLFVDPSFESNPLISFITILGSPFTTGAWGAESATITGPFDGITPANGSLMLSMTDDGNIATQAWQLTDVTPYTADINAGLATIDADALFNVPAAVAAGVSSLNVQFLDSSHNAIGTGANIGSGPLDSNVATWQALNITSFPVPIGTQYLRTQLAYANLSMIDTNGVSRAGYVDDTHITLTAPEPSTLVLIAAAVSVPLLRRRTRAREA